MLVGLSVTNFFRAQSIFVANVDSVAWYQFVAIQTQSQSKKKQNRNTNETTKKKYRQSSEKKNGETSNHNNNHTQTIFKIYVSIRLINRIGSIHASNATTKKKKHVVYYLFLKNNCIYVVCVILQCFCCYFTFLLFSRCRILHFRCMHRGHNTM